MLCLGIICYIVQLCEALQSLLGLIIYLQHATTSNTLYFLGNHTKVVQTTCIKVGLGTDVTAEMHYQVNCSEVLVSA